MLVLYDSELNMDQSDSRVNPITLFSRNPSYLSTSVFDILIIRTFTRMPVRNYHTQGHICYTVESDGCGKHFLIIYTLGMGAIRQRISTFLTRNWKKLTHLSCAPDGVTKVIESSLSQTLYQLYTNPCHIMPDKSCSHVPVVPAAAKSAGICLVSKRWATGFCTDDRDAGQEKRGKLTAMAATAHVPPAAAQPDSQVVTSLDRARAACLS